MAIIKHKKAFSLIELSIVILIIGILVAAISKGSDIYDNVKLVSARSITKSSIVNSIKGIIAWYETTLPESFNKDEANDGQKISAWLDTNPHSTLKINLGQTSENAKPTYQRFGINNLPSIKLDGLTHLISNGFNIKNNQMTIFIVAVRQQVVAESSIADFTSTNALHDYNNNQSFLFYEGSAGQFFNVYRNGSRSVYSPHIGTDKNYILTVTFDGTNNQIFINGDPASAVGSPGNFDIQRLIIGGRWVNRGVHSTKYKGLYGEVILFDSALIESQIKSIERYLSKKWNIKLKS